MADVYKFKVRLSALKLEVDDIPLIMYLDSGLEIKLLTDRKHIWTGAISNNKIIVDLK